MNCPNVVTTSSRTEVITLHAPGVARRVGARACRGFTFVELVLVCVIVTSIAALAIPYFMPTGHGALCAAADRLSSDIGYAQACTIADPTNPARIQFTDTGYTLVNVDTPVSVTFTQAGFSEARGVTLQLANVCENEVRFNHYGAVEGDPVGPAPTIALTAIDGRQLELRIHPSTGAISRNWIGP